MKDLVREIMLKVHAEHEHQGEQALLIARVIEALLREGSPAFAESPELLERAKMRFLERTIIQSGVPLAVIVKGCNRVITEKVALSHTPQFQVVQTGELLTHETVLPQDRA